MYYLVYLNGFCNGNKGGHALDTSATPQQTQKYIKKRVQFLSLAAITPYNLSQLNIY